MSIRAVLFDLGHTLWDVRYDEALAVPTYRNVRRRLTRAGRRSLPSAERLREAVTKRWVEEEIDAMRNGRLDQRPAADIIAEGLATLDLKVGRRLLDAITDDILWPDAWGRSVEADTVAALRALKERGLRLGIVSNTYQRGPVLRDQLSECGALPYLDVTVFSSDMGLRKPHPSLFQTPLAALGVPPQEAVFVGDSPDADIRGAQAVGMRAVLTHEYRHESVEGVTPDHVISRLPEVIEYVDGLSAEGR
jgi:putative hydrolase of the HAD superfamily